MKWKVWLRRLRVEGTRIVCSIEKGGGRGQKIAESSLPRAEASQDGAQVGERERTDG